MFCLTLAAWWGLPPRAAAAPIALDRPMYYVDAATSSAGSAKVYRITGLDPTTQVAVVEQIASLPGSGAGFGGLVYTAMISSYEPDRLYVVEAGAYRLGYYDLTTGGFTVVGTVPVDLGGNFSAVGGDFSPSGGMYVASAAGNKIRRLDPHTVVGGVVQTQWFMNAGLDVNGFDIAFDTNGDLLLGRNSGSPAATYYRYDTLPTASGQTGSPTLLRTGGSSHSGLAVATWNGSKYVFASRAAKLDVYPYVSGGTMGAPTLYSWQLADGTPVTMGSGDLAGVLLDVAVPEPGVLGLFGALMLALAVRMRAAG
ncbi:MAG: hypothetical protein D6776_09410 [Planctomycetota bacterium]|nr:MAG: hypothetical protein D6776_09410 [Planctomycetota bacterium]